MPQREEVDWRFPVTVLDVVLMGTYPSLGWIRRPGRRDRAYALDCLDQMAMADLAPRPIGELSGGQQQRVFLARALAQSPCLLLLDEPFAGVDVTSQEIAVQALQRLGESGVTSLVSTHDISFAANKFDQVLLLNRRLLAYGPPDQVLDSRYALVDLRRIGPALPRWAGHHRRRGRPLRPRPQPAGRRPGPGSGASG